MDDDGEDVDRWRKKDKNDDDDEQKTKNQPAVGISSCSSLCSSRVPCLLFRNSASSSTSTVRTGGCVLTTIGVVYDKGLGSANSSSLSRATVNEKKCAPAVQKDAIRSRWSPHRTSRKITTYHVAATTSGLQMVCCWGKAVCGSLSLVLGPIVLYTVVLERSIVLASRAKFWVLSAR
jgi:hypothetical protein